MCVRVISVIVTRVRSECASIAAMESAYWAEIDTDNDSLQDIAIGAVGAASNIVAAIALGKTAAEHSVDIKLRDGCEVGKTKNVKSMKTLTMTKGLPGSGKSTWSLQQVEESKGSTKRISKDDLRAMLDGGKWSRDNEKFVLKMRDQIAIEALEAGKHVIIDDTGFHEAHEVTLRALAKEHGAEFKIQDFTHVSIETCIERDLKRHRGVGEAVIRKMHKQYLTPKPQVQVYDPKKPNVYICDLDGTLCLMNGRGPYEGDKCDTDIVNEPVAHTLAQLRSANENVIFVSGRFEAVREKSIKWLKDNHVHYDPILFMRKDGDMRQDSIIKEEIYREHIQPNYNVIAVFDDRRRVVDATRALGYTVFQVADGEF